jgi:hypothetical protein
LGDRDRDFFKVENLPSITFGLPPSIVALLIFAVTLVCTFLLVFMLVPALGVQLSSPWYYFVFVQASLSAVIAYLLEMDWWWWLILFFFPLAVALGCCFSLPAYYYLLAFSFFLLLYWSTFRTQVPYYPSSPELPLLILELLAEKKTVHMIDIGSGFGGLMLHLAAERPDSFFSGIEIAPFPWLISVLRNKLLGQHVQFLRGDYNDLNFANYDIVFAYLSPRAMPDLWVKAKNEMCSGALLLSYEFIIPDNEPNMCINSGKNNPNLYVWRI